MCKTSFLKWCICISVVLINVYIFTIDFIELLFYYVCTYNFFIKKNPRQW